jgi:predicted extracellular nuclease
MTARRIQAHAALTALLMIMIGLPAAAVASEALTETFSRADLPDQIFNDRFEVRDVSIYEIQTPVNVSVDDTSPLVDRVVMVDGVVTAAPGEIGGPATAVIQEAEGGPYSGVRVVGNFSSVNAQRGDIIRVIGVVNDPFGKTQVSFNDNVELIGTTTAPQAVVLSTSQFVPNDVVVSEQWEGVLIEFNDVTVTDENPDAPGNDFGEWLFTDGSAEALGDSFSTTLTIDPTLGETFTVIRGIGWFSFGDHKVQPRNDADFN